MERSVYLYLEGQEGSTTVDPGDSGEATQLSLSHWLWLGGLEDMMGMLPASLAVSSQLSGCIQKVTKVLILNIKIALLFTCLNLKKLF